MSKHPTRASYDVAIIGAGVAGLSAAAILSKAGLSVCVVEKEPHVGGYLAGFRRKDFRFDTAIHWLNQCGEGGLVNRLFDLLGPDHPLARPQQRIRRYVGKYTDYLLTNNPDELKARLIEDFPGQTAGINKFFATAHKFGRSLSNFNRILRSEETMSWWERISHKLKLLQFAIPFIPYLRYSGAAGFPRGLKRFFSDDRLCQVFASETELLSCLIPIGWAYYGDFQSPPQGGSQVFPEWLQSIVRYYGNDICCSAKVQQVIFADGACRGLRFSQKGIVHEVFSKYVIAASDIETLYEQLLPADAVPARLKDRLKNADLYSSSVTVSIALDCNPATLGFNEEMIHIDGEGDPFGQITSDPATSEISILAPSWRDPTLAPTGKGTLTLYMPANMNDQDFWQTSFDGQGNFIRGEAYQRLKTRTAETLISRVEQRIAPGLRAHILFYELSTPVTHWRYTGNRGGSIMGAKPGRKNMVNKIAHYKTPVKNLIMGGHWAELGGGVPIAVKAAANASLIILRKENKKAFLLLARYLDCRISLKDVLGDPAFRSYDGNWKQRPTPAQQSASTTTAAY